MKLKTLAAAWAAIAALLASFPSWGQTPGQAGQFEGAYSTLAQDRFASVLSYDTYLDTLHSLDEQFDYICGDTFCEGEYGNLQSLGIECSLHTGTGAIGQCAWTFSGSTTEIDPATGHVAVQHRTFVCDFGIEGGIAEFGAFVRAAGVRGHGNTGFRDTVVPGRADGATLYDVVGECLRG